MLHAAFLGFEGIPGSKLTYATTCLPNWKFETGIWSTRAAFAVSELVHDTCLNPVPQKKDEKRGPGPRKERSLKLLAMKTLKAPKEALSEFPETNDYKVGLS